MPDILDYGLNRDGIHIWFEHAIDNCYILKQSTPNNYRVGGKFPNDITFIDPSGGPFMEVGTFKIDNHTLIKVQLPFFVFI